MLGRIGFAALLLLCAIGLATKARAATFDATVSWTDNSTNEDGFRVYRNGTQIGVTGPNVSTFTDTGLAENTQYCYQIGAFTSAGEAKGGQACGTTGVVPTVPSPPGTPTIIFIGKP